MKFIPIIILCILINTAAFSQVKKRPVTTAKPAPIVKPIEVKGPLKNHNDSVNYAAGANQVALLKGLHTTINLNAFDNAINDSLMHNKPRFTPGQINDIQAKFKKPNTKDSTTISAEPLLIAPEVKLNNFTDSLSYAVGLTVATTLFNDIGIRSIDFNIFNMGVLDGITNKTPLLNRLQTRAALANIYRLQFINNLIASNKFMAENKTQRGVVTLPSGLQYMVLRKGTGANVMMGDSIVTNYKGTLANGIQFDSSYDRGVPLKLNDITMVISGWTEGLQLMNLGAKYRFFIPPNLAYGSRHRSNVIVPYSALIFDVEVLKINNRAL